MGDRPLLFSGPMVRALLNGSKTQTRRVLTHACDEPPAFVGGGVITAYDERDRPYRWPRTNAVGDRIYVREHWRTEGRVNDKAPSDLKPGRWMLRYEADGPASSAWGRHRQGMHMPRWASRLTLIVTEVSVERLQDISEADAVAEGVERCQWSEALSDDGRTEWHVPGGNSYPTAKGAFFELWNNINAKRGAGWETNPWVCALTFTVHRCNIDQMPGDAND